MSRAEASGDQRIIAGKIAARYDSAVEAEVIAWLQNIVGDPDIRGGGMREVEKSLKNGQQLVKLCIKIREGTPQVPDKAKKMRLVPNKMSAPFKQMENIQTFLTFAENYGVPKSCLFQTVDLYEGRNMAQFLSGVQSLGTECQRLGFNGMTIGSKPTEKNIREFSEEQMKAGQSIIGLQAGSNKGASQKGMSIGAARHVADIRCDDMSAEGAAIIGGQSGYTGGASQKGMSMGASRHAADIRADDMSAEGAGIIGGQAGYTGGASQKGMGMGSSRHVADIKSEAGSKEGQAIIGGQAGYTGGASQAGMRIGASRHVADIPASQMDQKSSAIINLQMGSTGGASQQGMNMGGRRNIN